MIRLGGTALFTYAKKLMTLRAKATHGGEDIRKTTTSIQKPPFYVFTGICFGFGTSQGFVVRGLNKELCGAEHVGNFGFFVQGFDESIVLWIGDVAGFCCDRFEQTRPFPSKRLPNYQHVGQVFDAEDSARLLDIDGFIRGVPTPHSCRLNSTWIYG